MRTHALIHQLASALITTQLQWVNLLIYYTIHEDVIENNDVIDVNIRGFIIAGIGLADLEALVVGVKEEAGAEDVPVASAHPRHLHPPEPASAPAPAHIATNNTILTNIS